MTERSATARVDNRLRLSKTGNSMEKRRMLGIPTNHLGVDHLLPLLSTPGTKE